jgi:hypothetical protein
MSGSHSGCEKKVCSCCGETYKVHVDDGCNATVPPYWDRINECTSETCHRPLPCLVHPQKTYTVPLSDPKRTHNSENQCQQDDRERCPSCRQDSGIQKGWHAKYCMDPWHGVPPMCPSCGSINPKYWNYSRTPCPDLWHPFNHHGAAGETLARKLAVRAYNLMCRITKGKITVQPSMHDFEKELERTLLEYVDLARRTAGGSEL